MFKGIFRDKKAITKTSFIALSVLVLIFSLVMIASGVPAPTLSTDKADYAPGETVLISGNGFSAASATTPINIKVTRPDSTVHVCPDSYWCPSPLPTSSSFSNYPYILNGITGTYIIDATDGTNSAQMTFTDGRSINWTKVNGASSVTVAPSAQINLQVSVNLNGGSHWESTKYQIGGTAWSDPTGICVDTPDHTSDGSETFQITAPSTLGTYNLFIKVYSDDSCGNGASGEFKLTNGITVQGCAQASDCPDKPNTNKACTSNTCQYTCISSQYGNCDGTMTNGCETDLFNSLANCGSCQHACTAGQTCVSGVCTTSCTPTTEVCDGVDNDCNAQTPDGSAESWYGQTCDGADTDLCKEGTWLCTSGSKICSDATGNTAEVCGNQIDDDCDGSIDEGCEGYCTSNSDCSSLNTICADGICNGAHQCIQQFKSPSTTCRASAGDCDIAETCTGSSAACPSDAKSTAQCRQSAGQCDLAENCDGINNNCPADAKAPSSTPCDDGLFCSATDHCNGQGSCVQLTPRNCDDQNACTLDSCDEGQDICTHIISDSTGPVTSNLTVKQVSGLCQINIDAFETDACSNIAAAEFFLNSCGVAGTGISMNAKNGPFDSQIEEVIKLNYNNGLSDGLYTVYVRGQDSQGNWGACKAININLDCIAPNDPTCNIGNTNPYDASSPGILINNSCNAKELLVCGNNPIIKANICDSQSRIQLAEYFLNQDCEHNPEACFNWQGINMTVIDGLWDERCEDVQGTIDISQLSEGTHYIELHGKDGAENWGKFLFPPVVSFIVDRLPPETTKQLNPAGDISVPCSDTTANGHTLTDGCAYVKQGTTITLTSSDPDTPTHEHAGNVVIHYNVYWRLTESDPWTLDQTGQSTPDHSVTITLSKDSYHLIEYWSVDDCNYAEQPHYELDIVDTQAPTFTKTVGEPKVPGCNFVGPNDPTCDWYVTTDTEICITATDPQPHPVNNVQLTCEYTWWAIDPQGDPTDKVRVELNKNGCFTYKEDSYHELHCTATDALGNTAQLYEADIVDTQKPVTTKVIGDPKYIGPPGCTTGDCKVYIDGVTTISLTCVDPQPHPVDNVKIYYRYRVDDAPFPVEWTLYTVPFGFPEESQHEIEYYCIDALGNEETHWFETDYVDHTPPVTTKSYGKPLVEAVKGGYPKWITSATEITLTAEDPDTTGYGCNSGVKETKYRVTLVPDSNCYETCLATGTGEFLTYSFPFTISQDSCHLIEYYSVDHVDKTETIKKQCVFVDNTPPVTTKNLLGLVYVNNSKTYINGATKVNLVCADNQPHPVNGVTLQYRYRVSEDNCKTFGDWKGWTQYTEPFSFPEDSCHQLEYYCVDALGNTEQTQNEIDYVDLLPPTIVVWNPTEKEAGNIERCMQSIVVEVLDLKSGVNTSTVYAQLYYQNGSIVPNHMVVLKKTIYGTYEGLMDKQLPVGNYVLKIFATDNVGNQAVAEIAEYLPASVFVEYISPATCNIDPETGGSCDFTFHVCMRGGNSVEFWLNKLGGIITPDMMDAVIFDPDHPQVEAFVGLRHDNHSSEAEGLQLSCGEINGKEQFTLHLDVPADVASQLGLGEQNLEYWIESANSPCVCGDGILYPGSEVCDSNSQSCTTAQGYSGTQSCNAQCNGWNTCSSNEYCGDGIVNNGEQCELPNTNNNVLCAQSTQECSGNKLGTRDVSGNCNVNCGCVNDAFNYQCTVGQCGATCDDDGDCLPGQTCDQASCSCTGTPYQCGNGILEGTETCDDGANNGQPNHCNGQCSGQTTPACGNSVIESGEQCDDGNLINDDGCSSSCDIESEWSCVGEPSVCTPLSAQ